MVRIALPRGDLRSVLALMLADIDFQVPDYDSGSRALRFNVSGHEDSAVRVFSDRDIPIQVALGNYDLAICSRTSIDELLTRYPQESIVPLKRLNVEMNKNFSEQPQLVLAGSTNSSIDLLATDTISTITTEFPNIALRFLTEMRARNYRILDVWAKPESWPPEDAMFTIAERGAVLKEELRIIARVHDGGVWLIANKQSLSHKDLSRPLEQLLRLPTQESGIGLVPPKRLTRVQVNAPELKKFINNRRNILRLAVPDGHAQRHTVAALEDAGLNFDGYTTTETVRRPTSSNPNIEIKVFRPQDMPRAVSLGLFDIAMTGRDWLMNFLASYPEAPVEELVDLKRSEYKLGAVVSKDLGADSIEHAINIWRTDNPDRVIRVASEYASLADKYARTNQLGRYSVIPISGASEGFVPEDAEILIEGTETGASLEANNLMMLDVMIESTNCIIGRIGEYSEVQTETLRALVEKFAVA
jgi:ATP phosphoribosyltransferase